MRKGVVIFLESNKEQTTTQSTKWLHKADLVLSAIDGDAVNLMKSRWTASGIFHRFGDLPIPMLLWCPECGKRHVDEGEFATKYHHTHACQHCGHVWRPAVAFTVGVQFLPGFKDEVSK